jgi:hypothetical protein
MHKLPSPFVFLHNSLVGCHSMSVLILSSILVYVPQVGSSFDMYTVLLILNGSTVLREHGFLLTFLFW